MKSFTIRSAAALSALLLAVSLPAANAADEVSKGCYSSAGSLEDQGAYTYQSDGYCQKLCLDDNYSVFALTGGTHCLCGNKLPSDSDKTSDSNCDKDCAGWPDVKCGGKEAYSVYLTGLKQNVDKEGSSSSSSSSSTSSSTDSESSTTTQQGHMSTKAGHTVFVTSASQTGAEAAAETNKEDKKDSGPNTAAIAAGVVVGVVGFCALVGAIFFLWRFRSRKAAENQYRRSVGVDNYGGKPMSQSSMSDSRFDGDFMAQRRQSNGSIDDDQDFSRRILQVTNPDRGH
ncbi:Stress-activated PKC1-MPK1 kinase pathway sensor [Aspergillus melleus]|uniref:Stress-activated PKC1-MPK1 kinase pathway sensor n=1 Tax=Aspergillus melleus TaxID=138277 RepID=UPI001E8CA93C|nr:Stress-activated PKC1-MPK1 kinase pathway sensor [Aspergillus melleus]KAH8434978.1 Stress-activated PKC1-MPK1 kinase pathway sensor [Aspergillus melleus]